MITEEVCFTEEIPRIRLRIIQMLPMYKSCTTPFFEIAADVFLYPGILPIKSM